MKDIIKFLFSIGENSKAIELKTILIRYELLIRDVHDSCLCERSTKGFDYHEIHPKLGKGKGRWLTPCDLIEQRVGFSWKYSTKEGVGDSWKELNFKLIPVRKDGFN